MTKESSKKEFPFFNIAAGKVLLMMFFSFGIYAFYWTYKQWRETKKTDKKYKDINLILRTVFMDIFLFPQTNLIKKKTKASVFIYLVPVVNLCSTILSFVFMYKISATYLIVSTTIYAIIFAWLQYRINASVPKGARKEERFRGSDFSAIVIGVILAVLTFSNMSFLEEFPTIKCKPYTEIQGELVFNECLGVQITAPSEVSLKISDRMSEPFTIISSNTGDIRYYFEIKGTNNKMKDFDVMSAEEVSEYKENLLKKSNKANTKEATIEIVQINGKMVADYRVTLYDGWISRQYIFVHNDTTYNIMINSYEQNNTDKLEDVMDSVILSESIL